LGENGFAGVPARSVASEISDNRAKNPAVVLKSLTPAFQCTFHETSTFQQDGWSLTG
jgi:hypothetical protein